MEHKADWMYEKKWGIMVCYLADYAGNSSPMESYEEQWNKRINQFNVRNFVKQLSEIKCGWLIFTMGQNSGYYCSPNQTYDEIVERKISRLSKRDLIKDLAEELNSKDIKLICYLPSHAPVLDTYAVEKLKCTPSWDGSMWGLKKGQYKIPEEIDERLTEFQKNWQAIIREWSNRWGKLVSGWWFDGCYYADKMYNHPDAPNFKSFAESAKSGNKDSIVAFNPGVKIPVISFTEYEDYTAGEISHALPVFYRWLPLSRFIKNVQFHILTFLGDDWGRGNVRFSKELITGYTKHINSFGGAITYDILPPDENGNIPPPFLDIFKNINDTI
ncbi:MAG: alpha-L-fucosidase [Candidatus Omnitrophica bacterium]|jgi:hypothetical protein|nr:alpha-L-fucosidase [Candidatus Omnitrophota bacterium]